jgi:hypothetical protein
MPSFAESLRPMISSVRSLPGILGLRPYSASIITGAWSGSATGSGAETTTTIALTEGNGQPCKVRWLNSEELAVGDLQKGTIEIGPITPGPGGNNLLSQIHPALSAGQTIHVLVNGPDLGTAKFEITSFNADHALHYTIQAKPVGT